LEADDDTTSDYGTSIASSTTSIARDVLNYTYENGRRYTRASGDTALMPNDETEQDRLDLTHHLFLLTLGGALYVAPLGDSVHRVLDCGTGTGIWALDMGETHPTAEVIGVDLSPIQPAWVYPNVRFEVDDLEKDWTWPANHFDYIHSRSIAQGIRDWDNYVKQMYKHTAPEGYVELVEQEITLNCDDDTYEGSNLKYYMDCFSEAATLAGLIFPTEKRLREYVEDAGFTDVKVQRVKLPWGPWPKDKEKKKLGAITTLTLKAGGFEAYAMALFTKHLGKTAEEVTKLATAAVTEVESRKVHAYQIVAHVVGRKPADI